MGENMMKHKVTLYYAHDPMCSWCWGFAPTWKQLADALQHQVQSGQLEIRKLLGGLAPDSDEPMPAEMQAYLQKTWHSIAETIPGTRFNYDFWKNCTPRRSTYPACRAVIAAREQGEQYDGQMTSAIQQAYYLEAQNPSDRETLINVAEKIGLQRERFENTLDDAATRATHEVEMLQVQQLGFRGFPSLAVVADGRGVKVPVDYGGVSSMLGVIQQFVSEAAESLQ